MFYKTLLDFMRADNAIAATVTEYADNPSIFMIEAPEEAVRPYIIVRIDGRNKEAGIVKAINVYIDYFDDNKSRGKCEDMAIAVGDRLDRIILNTDPNYGSIRLFLNSEGHVPETDSRDIHYNLLFSASATRRGWGQKYANK